jgi:hypothetical protein
MNCLRQLRTRSEIAAHRYVELHGLRLIRIHLHANTVAHGL